MGLDKVGTVMITLLTIIAIALVTFIVADKLGDVASADDANGYAANATAELEQAMFNVVDDAPVWGQLIAVGVLVAIVFGFVLGAMFLSKKGYI